MSSRIQLTAASHHPLRLRFAAVHVHTQFLQHTHAIIINGTRGPSFACLSAVPPSAICGFVATPSSPTSHISTFNMVLQIISVAPAIRGQAVPSDGTNIPACLPKDFVRAENGFNSFVLPSCALQKGRQAAHLSSHTSAIWTFAT